MADKEKADMRESKQFPPPIDGYSVFSWPEFRAFLEKIGHIPSERWPCGFRDGNWSGFKLLFLVDETLKVELYYGFGTDRTSTTEDTYIPSRDIIFCKEFSDFARRCGADLSLSIVNMTVTVVEGECLRFNMDYFGGDFGEPR